MSFYTFILFISIIGIFFSSSIFAATCCYKKYTLATTSFILLILSIISLINSCIKIDYLKHINEHVAKCINEPCDIKIASLAKNHLINTNDSLNNLISSIKVEIDKNNNLISKIENNTSIKYNVQVKSDDNIFDITITGKGKNISDKIIPSITDSTKPLINSIKNNF